MNKRMEGFQQIFDWLQNIRTHRNERMSIKVVKYGKQLVTDLLSLLFPPLCMHCRTYQSRNDTHISTFCADCIAAIPGMTGGRCVTCGLYKGPHARSVNECENCQTLSFSFTRTMPLGNYDSPLQDWIHRMKFQKTPSIGYSLGYELGQKIRETSWTDDLGVLCPVPLNVIRETRRSFNQTMMIARGLQYELDIPIAEDVLVKTTKTKPQVELTRQERLTNLQNAFDVRDPSLIRDQHVLLVDDVMTTGGTANACSNALIEAGNAKTVSVAVLAR